MSDDWQQAYERLQIEREEHERQWRRQIEHDAGEPNRQLERFRESQKEGVDIERGEAKRRRTYSILVLVFCAVVLGGLAFLFRNSTIAVVPLAGIVLFLVMWPLYDKIRDLKKVSAEFGADRLSLNISGGQDELGFLTLSFCGEKQSLKY